MAAPKLADLPEVFRPDDSAWASRATARGDLRRLARGIYTTNTDEPLAQLNKRRWWEITGLLFPGAVLVDRSALDVGPAAGDQPTVFLDTGPSPAHPRPVELDGLTVRPRAGAGPVEGDMPYGPALYLASNGRSLLENLRRTQTRRGVRPTLTRSELETWLDQQARTHGEQRLNQLRDASRSVAPVLGLQAQFEELDALIGALLGTRAADLQTAPAIARGRRSGFDTSRLARFEVLRAALASTPLPSRPASADPLRLQAFYEAYFSNWIEGTEFEVDEAERIIFEGLRPPERPADAHDVAGTFEATQVHALRAGAPATAGELDTYLRAAHRLVMGGRPEALPGEYKTRDNRAGLTEFVRHDLVEGTLREGFAPLTTLPDGLPRAIYAAFLVAEVHPFTDGNGRVARLVMNAYLSAAHHERVMIPLVYRNEYLTALRALTRNDQPAPLLKVMDRAQRWVTTLPWTDRQALQSALHATNALVPPDEGERANLHLIDGPLQVP